MNYIIQRMLHYSSGRTDAKELCRNILTPDGDQGRSTKLLVCALQEGFASLENVFTVADRHPCRGCLLGSTLSSKRGTGSLQVGGQEYWGSREMRKLTVLVRRVAPKSTLAESSASGGPSPLSISAALSSTNPPSSSA